MVNIKVVLIFVLFFFILAEFFTPEIIDKYQINRLSEPEFETYTSDEASFLKTFYLMKHNLGYYRAFKLSRENGASGNNLQQDIFTWRMPVVFYLWKIFASGGMQIFKLYIFLSLLSLFSIYLILKKMTSPEYAILGPLLLLPYFYDTFRYKTAFLFTEWWGLLFFVIGLSAYFHKSQKLALLCFIITVSIRELFIIPVMLLLVWSFLKKGNFKIIFLAVIFSGIIYFIHIFNIREVLGRTTDFSFFSRFHPYHLADLQKMISFSMKEYVFWGLKTHYLFVFLGMLGLARAVFNKNREAIFLLVIVLGFILFLPLISTADNDYWGIMFVPIIIVSIPLLLKPKNENINSLEISK